MLKLLGLVMLVFSKIGLFTLGGGLAVIALVQQETLARGWLTQKEFLDILSVAQVTPGAIGVNAATFTGWRTAVNAGGGLPWAFATSLAASLAVMAASVIGVAIAGTWFERNRSKPWLVAVFAVLRPVVAGAIFAVGVNLVLGEFGAEGENGALCIYDIGKLRIAPLPAILCIFAFAVTLTKRFSPVWALALAAVAGLVF